MVLYIRHTKTLISNGYYGGHPCPKNTSSDGNDFTLIVERPTLRTTDQSSSCRAALRNPVVPNCTQCSAEAPTAGFKDGLNTAA